MRKEYEHARDEIDVGECMTIVVWSDSAELHIHNLSEMTADESLIKYVRDLHDSVIFSLSILAHLCEQNDPRLNSVHFFYGYSHLVRKNRAEEMGFTVSSEPLMEYEGKMHKKKMKDEGYRLVKAIAGKNKEWKRWKKNYKSPQFAFITREELIAHYGSINDFDESTLN